MRAYSRRYILKRASMVASAAVGTSLTHVPMLRATESGNEKLGVAVIGCGIANVAISK